MFKTLTTALTVLLLAGCGNNTRKTDNSQSAEVAQEKVEQTQMCGGYTQQRPLTEEDQTLFDAVTEGMTGVVYTPESVATQVVAGTNYRFVCTAKTLTREPETYRAEVTVFQPLPGRGEAKITEIKRL